MLATLFKGMVIGIANIIPGVSGGTMAVILGIYDRLIIDLSRLDLGALRKLIQALKSQQRRKEIHGWLTHHDMFFLGLLGLGAVTAIIALSRIITYFLLQQHDPTYGFFFGLVVVSIIFPYRMMKRHSWRELSIAIIGVAFPLILALTLTQEQQISNAKQKDALKTKTHQTTQPESFKPNYAYLFLCGAIGISAMILPGISGSFILILLGSYFDILRAINHFDLTALAAFSVGMAMGLFFFVRLVNLVLKHYYSPTLAFLSGLMIGSLWNIWPFKNIATVGNKVIYLDNTVPHVWNTNVSVTLASMLAGCAIVLLLMRFDQTEGEKHGTL